MKPRGSGPSFLSFSKTIENVFIARFYWRGMALLDKIPAELADRIRSASELVRKHDKVLLISHYDADGISSAQIIRESLQRAGKEVRTVIFPTLSEEQIAMVRTMQADCVFMADMGASYLDILAGKDWDIAILEHHRMPPETVIPSRRGFVFADPVEFGIDGSKNACASAMSFLFAVAMDPNNRDLAPLAMAGMYGDKQNLGGFRSIDLAIVEAAVEDGSVGRYQNLAYPTGLTFYQAMMSCPDPYLVGTTGRSDKVNRFVKSCELAMTDMPNTISQERVDAFAEALAARMRRTGVTEEIIKDTFGDRYYSERYQMDVGTLSSILDGCGRRGNHEVAFDACSSLDFTEASMESQEYDEKLISMIDEVSGNVVQMRNIQYFIITEKGFAGNIASAIVRYLGDPEKPVIGVTVSDGATDISSRGTDHQLSMGLSLSDAMRDVCGSVGGQGGGHVIAAGGTIPKGSEEGFLAALDAYVGRQFGRR